MQFGKAIRGEWLLDDSVTFLNHGSFGACPRAVLAVQRQWQDQMESEPVRFMIREMPKHLDDSRQGLAAFLGAQADDLVFVHNATEGANAVIRSLLPEINAGDQLLTTSHGYRAIRQTMKYVADLRGAQVVDAEVPFPIASAEEVTSAIVRAITPRTKLAVIDHITSPTGVIFPIEQIIALFKERGIPVLIDGAHVPGQLDLNLDTLGADYYVGNCHKWLYAPKGAAFLWTATQHQSKIHPTVISHFYEGGYQTEFGWTGTLDPSAWLSIPAGIAFHQKLAKAGSEEYTRSMLLHAQRDISSALGVPCGAPESMIGNMCTFPLPNAPAATDDGVLRLHDILFDEYHIEVPAMQTNGQLYVRASATPYNDATEYDALKQALLDISRSGRLQ